MKSIYRLALAATTLALAACSNHFAQLEDIQDIFRPTTSGKAVRVVKDAPNPYLETAQQKKSAKQAQADYAVQAAPVQTMQQQTQRINTTQCRDADDWYLDGYRVGRSFNSQRNQMLQQRMNFCQLSQLPSQFRSNWERGFAIGNRESGVQPIKSKKGKKA